MKKTISVMLFKRASYSRKVLESIAQMEGLEDWEVYVYCDNPGHDKISKLASTFSFVKRVHLAPTRRGIKKANLWAINTNFNLYKSALNLHVEDDTMMGPDVLKFVEACEPYLRGEFCSVSLAGWMEKIKKPSDSTKNHVFSNEWFTCGYGWAMTREVHQKWFVGAKDVGDSSSWAKDFNNAFQKNNLKELRSYVRRSKNIGVVGSTHPVFGQGVLNCVDVGDDWTGNQGANKQWDFSLFLKGTI